MPHASFKYKIELSDVDFTKHLRLSRLLDFVLATAGSNASNNGFGIQELLKQNHTWVLSRVGIQIETWPILDEVLEIETWIEDCGNFTTNRNFILRNGCGEEIGAATSLWAMIDMETRKAVAIGEDYARFATGEAPHCARPQRILPIGGEAIEMHKVVYTDTDINRHTNSVRYVDFMLNTIPNTFEWIENHIVKRFDVSYVNESHIGDMLAIHREECEGGKMLFDIKNADAASICRMSIEVE